MALRHRYPHRLEFFKYVDGMDAYGSNIRTTSSIATVFGAIHPASNFEVEKAGRRRSEMTHKGQVRYDSGLGAETTAIQAKWYIRFDSRTFAIVGAVRDGNRFRTVNMDLLEVQGEPAP